METLQWIASATGLGFLAGLRLYATVLALGLAIRFQWIRLQPEFQPLEALANWWVIGVAGAAFILEFLADKIPWVDTVWDAVHTVIRPLGAAALALVAFGELSTLGQVTAALLAGGVALSSHTAKAATRVAVNQSPEPVSNIALSLAGDLFVPFGVWLVMAHPLIVGALVVVFLVVFVLVARTIFRLLRRRLAGWRETPQPAV
jgi:hypothetical protein